MGRAHRPWHPVTALVATVLLSGCTPAPVAPLPVEWPGPTPTPAAAPTTAPTITPARPPPQSARPPTGSNPTSGTPSASTPTPGLSPACLPAVIYPIDGSDPALLPQALCFEVAAILRVRNVGPGLLTALPAELAARNYAAGVHDVRFLGPGTVTVTISGDGGEHRITVLVVRSTG
nr:hypothetical protein [Micromonospora sp. DSM 115978]